MTDEKQKEIGFNNNVRVGKRKLHVQTVYESEKKKAVASIFDGGVLIDKRETSFKDISPESDLEKEVKQFHNVVISDLEMLFFVSEKVENSKQAASIKRLGSLFLEKGFFDEAIDRFQAALKLDSEIENGHFLLGQALYRANRFEEAQEELQKAVEITPQYPDVLNLYGKTQWKLGFYPQAIAQLNAALEINPDYHQAHYTLGLVLLKSNAEVPSHTDLKPPIERIKDAENHFRKALSLSTDYNRKLMENGFEQLKLKDEANTGIEEFEKAYEPAHTVSKSLVADSEFYLKFMFASLDKENKTLDHYIRTIERSVEQYPDYADLHKSLGTVYLIRSWHFFVSAVEEYRRAIDINPDFEKALKHLKLLENDSRGFLILLRAILK